MSFDLSRLDPRQLLRLKTHRAYRTCFGGESGKLVLTDLAQANFLGRTTFVADCEKQTFVHEGMRFAVLNILKILGVTEEELVERMQERETEDG